MSEYHDDQLDQRQDEKSTLMVESVRPRKPGTFVPGDSRINRAGPGSKRPRLPRLLRDMRQVFAKDASHDKTPGQKALRRLLEENPKDFVSRMVSLERAFAANSAAEAKRSAAESSEEPERDEGEDRVMELIRTSLAAIEDGKADRGGN